MIKLHDQIYCIIFLLLCLYFYNCQHSLYHKIKNNTNFAKYVKIIGLDKYDIYICFLFDF